MILVLNRDGYKSSKKYSWDCVLCDDEKVAMYFGKPLCRKHWEELAGMKLESD